MSTKILPIQVINDEKNNLGFTTNGAYKSYAVTRDSIFGDITYDFISDNYPEKSIDAAIKLTQLGLLSENDLVSKGVSHVTATHEDAEHLKNYCKSVFLALKITDLDFEIQYFDSLHDVEMQNLENMVFKH